MSNTKEKAPINWHFACQLTRIYENNISEAYKVQVDCLKDSESDSYNKNDMKEKVNDLVRLHEAMQEKLKTASYSEPIQILTLVPDKWSRIYCSEYFNVFEYFDWTSHEIKKLDGILAKPAPKKGKTITTETPYLVINSYEDDNFSGYKPGKKDYVAKVFVTCKNYILLQKTNKQKTKTKKHPNVNIRFPKFCALRPDQEDCLQP